MSWTSYTNGHCETPAEEAALALVLQNAAKYVNAIGWTFFGQFNDYTLSSELDVPGSIVEKVELAKPDVAFPGNVIIPPENNVIPGVDLSWTPPSIVFTDPVPAKPPYTGKGDIPDGFELPPVVTVPAAGTVPDMVSIPSSKITDSPKV